LVFILFFLITAPLAIFIHELGHALGARIVQAEKIHLYLGAGHKIGSFTCGKLTIHIGIFYFLGGFTLSERTPSYKKNERLIIILLGPVMNGAFSLVTYFLCKNLPFVNIRLFIYFNAWLFIMNLVPYKIGDKRSDGYMFLQTLLRDK